MDNRVIAELKRPFDWHDRPGKGRMTFKYVKGEDIVARLNDAFEYEWDTQIIDKYVDDSFVVVSVRLTVPVFEAGQAVRKVSKEAFGGVEIAKDRTSGKPVDLGNTFKSAFTNALKKAAEQLGLALKEDEEEYTAAPLPKVTSAPPKSTEGTVKATAVVTVTKEVPGVVTENPQETSEIDRARALLDGMKTEKPVEKEAPKTTNPFPTSGTPKDIITDIQLSAIEKMCKLASKTVNEAIKSASEGGVLDPSSSTKELSALTKLEAAAMIRYLGSLRAG